MYNLRVISIQRFLGGAPTQLNRGERKKNALVKLFLGKNKKKQIICINNMKIIQYNISSSKKKRDGYMDSFTENEQDDEPKISAYKSYSFTSQLTRIEEKSIVHPSYKSLAQVFAGWAQLRSLSSLMVAVSSVTRRWWLKKRWWWSSSLSVHWTDWSAGSVFYNVVWPSYMSRQKDHLQWIHVCTKKKSFPFLLLSSLGFMTLERLCTPS